MHVSRLIRKSIDSLRQYMAEDDTLAGSAGERDEV
jgi:hypothetical protein